MYSRSEIYFHLSSSYLDIFIKDMSHVVVIDCTASIDRIHNKDENNKWPISGKLMHSTVHIFQRERVDRY